MKKTSKNILKNSKGLTLVEIVIVLGIIGALAAFILPRITEQLGKSKQNKTKLMISQVAEAVTMFEAECGKIPDSLDSIVTGDATCNTWEPKKSLQPKAGGGPRDDWNNPLIYTKEGNDYTVMSYGADKREGGTGLNADLTNHDK